MAIPVLTSQSTYADFYVNFLLPNKFCLFSDELTVNWPARRLWTQPNGTVNIGALLEGFKEDGSLCVADCRRLEFGAHPTLNLSPSEYLSYWKSRKRHEDEQLLYLKDWHYFRGHEPALFFTTPVHFSSDWLNEFFAFRTDVDDDFKFVYAGPKGTWTPLHSDVYRSYSWSVNVVGVKRWWMFPPGEEKKLLSTQGHLPPDIRDRQFAFQDEDSDLPRCYCFDQFPGQAVFVPSGWYHEVLNLTDCVSINHNWINACNVTLVWNHLRQQLREVKTSTDDVKSTPGWAEACQDCLKAWEGWNYAEFFLLLKYVLLSRWMRLSGEGLREKLPQTALSSGAGLTSFRILELQVDTLLSDLAKASPDLVAHLRDTSRFSGLVDFLKQGIPSAADSPDKVEEWIRRHDLLECVRTLKDMFADSDFLQLGLPQRMPLHWLWEEAGFLRTFVRLGQFSK
uniref:Jumonji domain-containing protein 4 n=3 Tax=Schistocephalus solidus TaxID=70667 RepID=A0A0V0JCQ3_SCHSO